MIGPVVTRGYSIGSSNLVITRGYVSGALPILIIDSHDDAPKKHREKNEKRKLDVIKAFQRVTGIEIAPETSALEVSAEVQSKLFKPKKPPERAVLAAAIELEASEQQDEDDFISDIVIRFLH